MKRWLNLFLLLMVMIIAVSCSRGSSHLIDKAEQVKSQINKFSYNVSKAKRDLNEAYQEIQEIKLNLLSERYVSEQTKDYIYKAQKKIERLRKLRSKFKKLVKTIDFYFAYEYKSARQIKDSDLRDRMISLINRKKGEFTSLLKNSYSTLRRVDSSIDQLQGILNALEITASLHVISDKIDEVAELKEEIEKELSKVDVIIQQGYDILSEKI